MTPLPRPLSAPPLGLDPSRPLNKRARLDWICPGFVDAAVREMERMRQSAAKAEERFARRDRPETGTSDLGPRHRRRQGRVEVETIADPDSPNLTVRRGRVADPVARMVARGDLTRRHGGAANALRGLVELTGEGSCSPLTRLGMPRGGGGAMRLYPVGSNGAIAALERALRVAWPYGALVTWVAIDGLSLDAFARSREVRREEVPAWLKAGLTALADHFGCPS